LVGKANSAIDISDGFAGDLKKLLTASGVGGEIDIDKLPLSESLRERFTPNEQQQLALCGGDDYELCFTAAHEAVKDIPGITAVGSVRESTGLTCRRNGDIVEVDDSGYRHFQ
jgi:thiamine-monophosphate kinase